MMRRRSGLGLSLLIRNVAFAAVVINACQVVFAQENAAPAPVISQPPEYDISIVVNYDAARFSGREKVTFVNNSRDSTDTLNFNLYPNAGQADETRLPLSIERVRGRGRDLSFAVQSRGMVLKVNLGDRLAPGDSIQLTIDFSAIVPTIDPEETSLLAHFLEEINDAMGEDRSESASRQIFFAGEDGILLGYFFPLLAAGSFQDLDRMPAAGVKSAICAEVANYRVQVTVTNRITVIGSGEVVNQSTVRSQAVKGEQVVEFRAKNLRSFSLFLGEHLKPSERTVRGTRVTTYSRPGSERVAERMSELAARAVEVFASAYGDYPSSTLQIVEASLPASFSGIDLPGMVVLAHAYFVDPDAAQTHLPSMLRSQGDIIRAALEFTLAHEIAHQWWGGVVGSDPQRSPFLDEALAQFSGIYFYEVTEGPDYAATVIEQQIRGTYLTYRMFGGVDMEVERPLRDMRSRLQYAAIAQSKGAFFLLEMRRQMGDERFFGALRGYLAENINRIASSERLRASLVANSPDPRATRLAMRRWLEEKHADEDIGNPSTTLLPQSNTGMRKLGRIFVWIGRAAARPF
jgi:hypothetical protein